MTSDRIHPLPGVPDELTLELSLDPCADGVRARLVQKEGPVWLDGPSVYTLTLAEKDERVIHARLAEVRRVARPDGAFGVAGTLGPVYVEHWFRVVPQCAGAIDEFVTLINPTDEPIQIADFEAGMLWLAGHGTGAYLPPSVPDRFAAVPFLVRPTDPTGHVNEWDVAGLLKTSGQEQQFYPAVGVTLRPSRHRHSEGWAWTRGDQTLAVLKFNQRFMEFSVLSIHDGPETNDGRVWLRVGGVSRSSTVAPGHVESLAPGARIEFGLTRFQAVGPGGHSKACAALRRLLDEHACRFPPDYNPPVHWNELYDNPEWWLITPASGPAATPQPKLRARTYTRALIHAEVVKARRFSCEALYLDPGWDDDFGTLRWAEERLGPMHAFSQELRDRHGLRLSLHCPLAPWMSNHGLRPEFEPWTAWPEDSMRCDAEGNQLPTQVCLGSSQYLALAAERMIAACDAGATFLMFDGNWYQPCHARHHGHPVPFTYQDQVAANIDLCRRVHAKHPKVHIEMHDMMCGPSRYRFTPVYFGYGLPGSFDCNWGFELMWNPIGELRAGRAKSLYYYNLGCNVPAYLHIDLREDNEHCTVFWWFASTCRHLGIGGTHSDPLIGLRQRRAMKTYRRLEGFFKRGEFVGASEEVHIHALPDEHAWVVNAFNLSDEARLVEARVHASFLNADPSAWYSRSEPHCMFEGKQFVTRVHLPAWGHRLFEIRRI